MKVILDNKVPETKIGDPSDSFLLEKFISTKIDYFTHDERIENHEHYQQHSKVLDGIVKDTEILKRYLKRFQGYIGPLEYINKDILKIEAIENNLDLPPGYAQKGGSARIVLEKTLGIAGMKEPRDIDICFVGQNENQEMSTALAEKYCPEDLHFGHGIEKLEDNYFESRDFTLNEVLVHGKDIYVTKECLLDTIRGIVSLSRYEASSYDDRQINDKLISKGLRLLAERKQFSKASFADEYFFGESNISEFHMALHLNRAMERGPKVTDQFLKELRDRGQIPENIITVSACMEYLQEYTDFIFQYGQSYVERDNNFYAGFDDDFFDTHEIDSIRNNRALIEKFENM